MYVSIDGVKLFSDVEGAGLAPSGPEMRSKPTLLLLHGGPGMDHSLLDECSHMSWVDQPERVMSAIREFLMS
jgi:pimeloyl-ACP methyl ester carboxylesterase